VGVCLRLTVLVMAPIIPALLQCRGAGAGFRAAVAAILAATLRLAAMRR
jgi:hypothetical protein